MKKYYLIGEISKLFNIPKQTLRYYEQEGILKSHKNEENGYRLYSLDDIIALTDIITYRSIGIPIKEIRNIFNTMNLDNIINVISETENTIQEKILYYTKMEEKIKKRKEMFIEAKKDLGKYNIVKESEVRYFSLSDDFDLEVYKNYLSDNYSYIIYIENQHLNKENIIDEIQYGLSIDNIDNIEEANLEVRKIDNEESEYLLSVIKVRDYTLESEFIKKANKWLKDKNKKVNGDLIGRYLASSYEDSTIDYYKIWVPICDINS